MAKPRTRKSHLSTLALKALITGASSGIGAATARRFAQAGYDVCLNARRESALRSLVESLPPGEHLVCAGDFSQKATAELIDRTVAERWDRLDVLVNAAGVSTSVDAMATPLDQWRQSFDLMVNGALAMSRLAAAHMTRGGRMIHLTSIHARRAEARASAYGMAKAAIEQWCRSLALELASRNILVNAIAPGFIDTPMSAASGVNELETPWFRKNYIDGDHLPLRRAGRPEEVAGVALFFAGPDATYITGQTIIVDGGLTITF